MPLEYFIRDWALQGAEANGLPKVVQVSESYTQEFEDDDDFDDWSDSEFDDLPEEDVSTAAGHFLPQTLKTCIYYNSFLHC